MILQSSSLYFPQGSQESVFWQKYQTLCDTPSTQKAVIADFHRTFSPTDEPTTWSICSRSGLCDSQYVAQRNALYETYHAYEIDTTMEPEKRALLVEEWFQKHLDLFQDPAYGFTRELFQAAMNKVIGNNLFRPGVVEMLKQFHEYQIPLVIISAGLGNFIDIRLDQAAIPRNFITLETNMLTYDPSGQVSGCVRAVPMTSMNKGYVTLSRESRDIFVNKKSILILGDDIEDVSLANHVPHSTVLRIAYCSKGHEPSYFDNTGYDAVYLGEDTYWMSDIVQHQNTAQQPAGVFFGEGLFA